MLIFSLFHFTGFRVTVSTRCSELLCVDCMAAANELQVYCFVLDTAASDRLECETLF